MKHFFLHILYAFLNSIFDPYMNFFTNFFFILLFVPRLEESLVNVGIVCQLVTMDQLNFFKYITMVDNINDNNTYSYIRYVTTNLLIQQYSRRSTCT